MQDPFVFISHSTSKAAAGSSAPGVLKGLLHDGVLAPRWAPFVDYESVEGGSLWRANILYHLAVAQAGILLLDEKASRSPWVQAEMQILAFRKAVDKNFRLIPVSFTDLPDPESFLRRFGPFQLEEVQFVREGARSVPELVQEIARLLGDPPGRTRNNWVDLTCANLREADEDQLDEAVGDLQCRIDLPHWPSEEAVKSLRRAVAQMLHAESVVKAAKVMYKLVKRSALSQERVQELVGIFLAKWVDNEAAKLLAYALRTPRKPIYAIETDVTDTLEIVDHYHRRADIETEQVYKITIRGAKGLDEELIVEAIGRDIQAVIVPRHESNQKIKGWRSPVEDINWTLDQLGAAACCFVPEECALEGVMKMLRDRFPRILFIVIQERAATGAAERKLPPDTEPLGRSLDGVALGELSLLATVFQPLLEKSTPARQPIRGSLRRRLFRS